MQGWISLDKFVIPIVAKTTKKFSMVDQRTWRVLILCTGNSARSVIGEYLLRVRGGGRFEVFSAGVAPTGKVNPLALWVLQDRYGIDASEARSQSTDEFLEEAFDVVITVCDHARETCPVWPNQPIAAHWGSPDPAAVQGSEDQCRQAFVRVAAQIAARVDLLCALPDEKIRAPEVRAIGGT
jgi:protein-tyrosine-phosphatase